jgi:hypothetical protein
MSMILAQTLTPSDLAFPTVAGLTNNADAVHRVMEIGGTPAGSGATFSITNATHACIAWSTPANHLNLRAWGTDNVVVPINITTANMNMTLARVIVRRVNSTGTLQATLADVSYTDSIGATGVISKTLAVSAQGAAATDRLQVVVAFATGNTMPQSFGVTSNQDVTAPLAINLTQSAFRFRNDDGSESAASWKAAQNTATTIAVGERFRLRVREESAGAGSEPRVWRWSPTTDLTVNTRYSVASGGQMSLTPIYGDGGTEEAQAQSFKAPNYAATVVEVSVADSRFGTVADLIYVDIVQALGDAPLSRAIIDPMNVPSVIPMPFAELAANTTYFLRISRSGTRNTNNYFRAVYRTDSDLVPGEGRYQKDNGTWSYLNTSDMVATIKVQRIVSWQPVAAQGATAKVRFANSTHLTDATSTTQQLTGDGTFAAGLIYESGHGTATGPGASGASEHEAVLELVSGQVSVGESLMFQLVRGTDTSYTTYSQYPNLTASAASNNAVATAALTLPALTSSSGATMLAPVTSAVTAQLPALTSSASANAIVPSLSGFLIPDGDLSASNVFTSTGSYFGAVNESLDALDAHYIQNATAAPAEVKFTLSNVPSNFDSLTGNLVLKLRARKV